MRHHQTRSSAAPGVIPPEMALAVRADLLRWYDVHARDLPWRVGPRRRAQGERPDPYRVWLSEIMLQQTTVAAVIPRFEAFLARFGSVEALAAADDGDVMAAWAGLGYYARARNLLACARAIVALGGFPETLDGWRALPGIGAYTAAAVSAIAFDRPHTPVDGNVERVLSRLVRFEGELPAAKPAFVALATALDSDERPGDFAQALMDLGSAVCRPKGPDCLICPLHEVCAARAAGDAESFPRKAGRRVRPMRFGTAWVIETGEGVLLRRRPPKGLLGAMMEPPGTDWVEGGPPCTPPPMPADWIEAAEVGHVFTHFSLRLRVLAARAVAAPLLQGTTPFARADLAMAGLPSVMAKAVAAGLAALDAEAAVCGDLQAQ